MGRLREACDLSFGTRKRWRPLLLRLCEYLRRDDLSGVSSDEARSWRDHLLESGVHGSVLSRATVGDAYLAAARAFFTWAHDERRVTSNPFSGVSVRASKDTLSEPRAPKSFSKEEATLILTETLRPADPRVSPKFAAARRWVPWICAYTGARVNEITQLRRQDVFAVVVDAATTIWVMRITPDAGTVKTRKARDIPLHPHLIEQGVLDYVQSVKAGPLFYNGSQPGTTANPAYRKTGDMLAAWVRAIGVDRDVAPNHGWRHGFITIARSVRLPEPTSDHICGHAPRTVGEGYGEFKILPLWEDVARLPRYEVQLPSEPRAQTAASKRASEQRRATHARARARQLAFRPLSDLTASVGDGA